MITTSITDQDLREATRQWLANLTSGEIVAGQDNRVAMPDGAFIVLTGLRVTRVATNTTTWVRPTLPQGPGEEQNARTAEWVCQVDCYGAGAADLASAIEVLSRSEYACEKFSEFGIDAAPTHATDARQTSMINAEEQYEERYTLELHISYTPIVTTPLEFAESLGIGLVNVDAKYPPLET